MKESSIILLNRELTESVRRLPAEIASQLRFWIEHNLQLEKVHSDYCKIENGQVFINLTTRFCANYVFCTPGAASKAIRKLVDKGVFIPGDFDCIFTGGAWYAFNLELANSLKNFFDLGILRRLNKIHSDHAEPGDNSAIPTEAPPEGLALPTEAGSDSNGSANSDSNGSASIYNNRFINKESRNAAAGGGFSVLNSFDFDFLGTTEKNDYAPHLAHIFTHLLKLTDLAFARQTWNYLKSKLDFKNRYLSVTEEQITNLIRNHGRPKFAACLIAIALEGNGNASPSRIRGFIKNFSPEPKFQPVAPPTPPSAVPAGRRPTPPPEDTRPPAPLKSSISDHLSPGGAVDWKAYADALEETPANA